MKAKTIKAVLRRKIDEWVDTIKDTSLRELVRRDAIVTGGAIASMLLGEDVHDFDVYFTTHDTTLKVARYYVNSFKPKIQNGIIPAITVVDTNGRISVVVKSAGIASSEGTEKPYEYFEARPDGEAGNYVADIITDPASIEDTYQEAETVALQPDKKGKKSEYRAVFISTNAITLSGQIQLVLRFYGEPEVIHASYDFVHCMNYWRSDRNELVLKPEALEALLAKELRYVNSLYPICSIIRLRKFLARGWHINAGQILKIAMAISKLDLSNYDVLRDQLTGVDTAYFSEVLTKLKDKDAAKVDSAYLVEIIDRLF